MYRIFISLRYLRRKKLNLIAIAGVAIGVIALLVVLSVMTGFEQEMRGRIRGTLSDLIIEKWDPEGGDSFTGYQPLIAKLKTFDHVVACAPRYEGLGIMLLGARQTEKKTNRWGQFLGIDLDLELQTTELGQYYRNWRGGDAVEKAQRNLNRLDELAAAEAPASAGVSASDDLSRRMWLSLKPDELASVRTATEQGVAQAVACMRREDFNRLSERQRAAAARLAAAAGVKLEEAWDTNAAVNPTWDVGQKIPASNTPVLMGQDMAVLGVDADGTEVRAEVGDRVPIYTVVDIQGSMASGHDFKIGWIAGKFKSGMYDYDLRNLYIPLEQAQRLVEKPGAVTSINVRLDDYAHADAVRRAILGIPSLDELILLHQSLKPVMDKLLPGQNFETRTADFLRELAANYSTWLAQSNPKLPDYSRMLRDRYFDLMDAAQARGLGDNVTDLAGLKTLRVALEARDKNSLGRNFRVSTWEDKRRPILRAVSVERRVMAVILFFMVVLSGFIILAILYTTVIEKTRDIGILKSIGGTVQGIMSIFLLNGFLIGLFGSILGTVGGILLCDRLNDVEDIIFKLTSWRVFPRDIYSLDKIPVDKDPFWSIVFIAATAIVISFLAAVYPAYKAARMHPVEALRHE